MRTYLTTTLHECFGFLSPLVSETPAAVDPLPCIAGSFFQYRDDGRLSSAVLIEPAFMEFTDPEHLVAIMAHEAVHIIITERLGPDSMPEQREELSADILAAHFVPQGACLLSDVYVWHLARIAPEKNQDLADRLRALLPLCAAQRTAPHR